MAHFAKINNENIVEQVLVVPDEQEHRGEEYLNEIGLKGRWIQTSYNKTIRKIFAGIGTEYLEQYDAFRGPAPFDSWSFNFELWQWEPPVAKPEDGQRYGWDEATLSWVEVTEGETNAN